ncbi:hypothetical protein DITRI_Ditri16bG0025200 [Diplodiscus trichospermus]
MSYEFNALGNEILPLIISVLTWCILALDSFLVLYGFQQSTLIQERNRKRRKRVCSLGLDLRFRDDGDDSRLFKASKYFWVFEQ